MIVVRVVVGAPLSRLFTSRVSRRRQGGARVSDLDRALARHGLAAAKGLFKNLGVVGTILSGGHGYASRKNGLAADNVVRA